MARALDLPDTRKLGDRNMGERVVAQVRGRDQASWTTPPASALSTASPSSLAAGATAGAEAFCHHHHHGHHHGHHHSHHHPHHPPPSPCRPLVQQAQSLQAILDEAEKFTFILCLRSKPDGPTQRLGLDEALIERQVQNFKINEAHSVRITNQPSIREGGELMIEH
jgi:hypothetical protein